jgi:hypothetical protein
MTTKKQNKMKTLESLKGNEFQKFEKDRMSNLAVLMGGTAITSYDKGGCATDCIDFSCSDGHYSNASGTMQKCDVSKGAC